MKDSKAITDSLFDYQHLFERLEVELDSCRKEKKPFSLIYLDIDYMKMINAENGYKAGDQVIKAVRGIVSEEIGENGTIITSNSDKQLIMLPSMSEGKAQMYAKQILKKIKEYVLPFDLSVGDNVKVTGVSVSVGLVTWDKVEKVQAEKLIELTETALKNAKEEGRGKNVQFQFYSKPTTGGKHIIDKKVIK